MSAIDVLLRADPQDGNDPIEQEIALAQVPRQGDLIELWDADSGYLNTRRDGSTYRSGESVYVTVKDVVWCGYAPERVEVWVTVDGFDLDQLRRIIEGAPAMQP